MNNRVLELNLFAPNIIFYCMEMKFVVCKNLYMLASEDFGSFEMELVLSILTVSFGLLGPDFY